MPHILIQSEPFDPLAEQADLWGVTRASARW